MRRRSCLESRACRSHEQRNSPSPLGVLGARGESAISSSSSLLPTSTSAIAFHPGTHKNSRHEHSRRRLSRYFFVGFFAVILAGFRFPPPPWPPPGSPSLPWLISVSS